MKPDGRASAMLASIRRLPPGLWLLAAGTLVNRFATFLVPFLTLFMTRQGFAPSEAGLAVTLYGAGAFLCTFAAGPAADRFGRNRIMAVSLLAEAIAVYFMGSAGTLTAICTLAAAAGFAGQGAQPAQAAMVADLVPERDRVAAMLVKRLAINTGWALGPAVAGFVAASHHYQWLFTADACTSAAFAVLSWFFLPRGNPQPRSQTAWKPALQSLATQPQMIRLLAATVIASFLFRQVSTSFNLHLLSGGYSEKHCGLVQSLNGLLVIALEIPLATITSLWHPNRAIGAGFALIGIGLAVNAAGPWMPIALASMTILTVGEMLSLPRHAARVQSLSPDHMRGRYAGMASIAWATGNMTGAWSGLALFSLHPNALWFLSAILGLLAFFLLPSPSHDSTHPTKES